MKKILSRQWEFLFLYKKQDIIQNALLTNAHMEMDDL